MGSREPGRGASCLFVVIGTRPEAIKLAPVLRAAAARGVRTCICITNQHPDLLPVTMAEMNLVAQARADIGHGTVPDVSDMQGQLRERRPTCVLIQGDTRSALAGGLAAALEGVPLAHVEAGLRTDHLLDPWPEEVYRRAIARLAQFHFAPTPAAAESLRGEGLADDDIWLTGNPIVDHLIDLAEEAGTGARSHILLTAHRTETDAAALERIGEAATCLARRTGLPVLHITHPRHQDRRGAAGKGAIRPLAPQTPTAFRALLRDAALVLTDSGGVQEEAAFCGIPALILRERTERPELLSPGFSELVGSDANLIVERGERLIIAPGIPADASVLGDGTAGTRIVDVLTQKLAFAR